MFFKYFNAKERGGKRRGSQREVGGRFFLPPNFGRGRKERNTKRGIRREKCEERKTEFNYLIS
jgi:hypothetical protein